MADVPDIKTVEEFFFRGMMDGFAKGGKPAPLLGLPGWVGHTHREGTLQLVDAWHTAPKSTKSTGITSISYDGVVIWVMRYGGEYSKEAIPVVHAALERNYSRSIFLGGRGPKRFVSGTILYSNEPQPGKFSFDRFEGFEYVTTVDSREQLGHHHYNGGWQL